MQAFSVELGYRLLSTTTTWAPDTVPERLQYSRDPAVASRAQSQTERVLSSSRDGAQQTIHLGVAFNL